MADAPDPAWTLGAVILGGFLAIIGQIIADQIKTKQEMRRENKNLLRANLYDIQDQLMNISDIARKVVAELDEPSASHATMLHPDMPDLRSEILRIGAYTVRVGDDPLALHVRNTTKILFEAATSTDKQVRTDKLLQSHDSLKGVQLRVGELLHTETQVDLGMEPTQRSQD